jgi:hypothetical protein
MRSRTSNSVLHKLPPSSKRLVVLVLSSLLCLAAVLLPTSGLLLSKAQGLSDVQTGSKTVELAPDAKTEGMEVNVGIQLKNIYDLNLASQSFLAEGWYWLSWNDEVQAVLESLKIEPTQMIEFPNEIEVGQFSVNEVLPEEVKVKSGTPHSLYVKFSGKFYIDEVAQRLAPFDPQRLKLALEVKLSSLTEGPNQINLVPISIEQLPIAGEFSSVNGFILTDTEWTRQMANYIEPLAGKNQTRSREIVRYSRATAILTYSPDPVTVFLKWLLPLIAVMGIVILSPSIDGTLGDVRLAIPSAALLTLVVLHDGYKENFPPAPYLTYLDEIYTYSYIACFVIFLLFLVGTNTHSRGSEQEREAISNKINRLDLIVQVSMISGFVIVASVGWFS